MAGRPVIQHQLDIALAFGCDRLVCMVRSLDPEVIALQHRAELAGVLFNTVSSPRDLSALVTAADEVVVLQEGLLAETARAHTLLEQGSGVFVQPIEAGLAAGFERIDINNASAGMLRIPGRLIEALVQLPPDSDVPSALTRIALQSGVSLRDVPVEARTGAQWRIIASEDEAHAIERDWIAHRLGEAPLASPGRWIARRAVLAFGSALLHAGNASRVMSAGLLVMLALALAAGWLGFSAFGFVFGALAWICLRCAAKLKRLERPASRDSNDLRLGEIVPGWGFDLVLVALIHWAAPPLAGTSPVLALAMPITFLLLVRLAGLQPNLPGAATISDRTVLSLLLAGFAAIGLIEWAVALGACLLAAGGLAATRARGG